MLRANKLHHKVLYQIHAIRYKLVFFRDLLAGAKFGTIKIFHVKQQRKAGKPQNSSDFLQEKEQSSRESTKLTISLATRHEAKLLIQISHLSAKKCK